MTRLKSGDVLPDSEAGGPTPVNLRVSRQLNVSEAAADERVILSSAALLFPGHAPNPHMIFMLHCAMFESQLPQLVNSLPNRTLPVAQTEGQNHLP